MKNTASKFPLPTGNTWSRLPERVSSLENPKLIKAAISQTNSSAPVLTILENNTLATLTPAYSTTGTYTITSDKAVFTAGKTFVTFGAGEKTIAATATITSTTVITVTSTSIVSTPALANSLFTNTPITIEIFN